MHHTSTYHNCRLEAPMIELANTLFSIITFNHYVTGSAVNLADTSSEAIQQGNNNFSFKGGKKNILKILVACEESQAVTIELRKLGHEAYSCDIEDCSGNHPEWHLKGDCLEYLNGIYKCKCGNINPESFGKYGCCGVSKLTEWDMMIAFPPCTYLATSGLHWNRRVPGREAKTKEALKFVKALMDAPIEKIAIENPPGRINTAIRKADQLIHPYYFGDEAQKKTCLWLKNLPKLKHIRQDDLFDTKTHVGKGEMMKCVRKDGRIEYRARWNQGLPPSKNRAKIRSKTFPGIAKQMAEQWTNF